VNLDLFAPFIHKTKLAKQATNHHMHMSSKKTHSNSSKNPHKIIHHEPQTFIKGWNWNQANFHLFLSTKVSQK
jgi:hypothetical protein